MIYIALGANLPSRYGQPSETFLAACKALEAQGVRIVAKSSIWLSAPVPVSDQPWYRNAVMAVETDMSAHDLLHMLKAMEVDFGREDAARNAARVLDLDIIAYHGECFDDPHMHIPHPRMGERAFVILPLQEIAPDWIYPISGCNIASLAASLPPEQKIQKSEEETF